MVWNLTTSLFPSWLKLSNLKFSQIIHTNVLKSPFRSDIFVQTPMLDIYVKCDQLADAYILFGRIPMRDVACWNVMLMGFVQLGFLDKVLRLFHEMRFARILPDTITVMGLTQASLETKNLALVKAIHAFGIQIGIDGDVSMANTWISAYSKCDDLSSAMAVFNGIEIGARTVVSWNSMIAGYANLEKLIDALNFYKWMLCDGYRPDISTIVSLLSSCIQPDKLLQGVLIHCHRIQMGCDSDIFVVNALISGCCQTGALELGKWIHNYAFSNGLRDSIVVCNALIDMHAKCGNINSAQELFYALPVRTVVSWTTMIAGFALNGNYKEALDLFCLMVDLDLKPNHLTFLAILQACTHAGLFFDMMKKVYKINPGVHHYISVWRISLGVKEGWKKQRSL